MAGWSLNHESAGAVNWLTTDFTDGNNLNWLKFIDRIEESIWFWTRVVQQDNKARRCLCVYIYHINIFNTQKTSKLTQIFWKNSWFNDSVLNTYVDTNVNNNTKKSKYFVKR